MQQSKREQRIKTTTANAHGLFVPIGNGGKGYKHETLNGERRLYRVWNPKGNGFYTVDVLNGVCNCAQFKSDGVCKHIIGLTRRVRLAEEILGVSHPQEEEKPELSALRQVEETGFYSSAYAFSPVEKTGYHVEEFWFNSSEGVVIDKTIGSSWDIAYKTACRLRAERKTTDQTFEVRPDAIPIPAEEKKERTYHVRRHGFGDKIGVRVSVAPMTLAGAEGRADFMNTECETECYMVHPDEEDDC